MTEDLVSVIMPAYNSEKYIEESINSVIKQTYTNWELIVINDGSTDNTAEIVQKKQKEDKRIFYYYQENGNQGRARNNGIKKSKGELIAFIDSDDLWVTEKLEIQISFFKESHADLIFSDGYIFTNDQNDFKGYINTIKGLYKGDKAIKLFFDCNRIPILSVLTTKNAISSVGGFEEGKEIQNVEDYHLWLKMLIKGFSIYGLAEKLVLYRRHENQMTHSDLLSSGKVFSMLNSYVNIPKHLIPSITRAKYIWGSRWYLANAEDEISALEILNKMSLICQFKRTTIITRLSLIFFGVGLSKKVMNKLISIKLKNSYI